MKYGKAKITFSIICLAAALTFAVFTVYAWFATVIRVTTGGIDAVIVSGDVISFDITYYYTSSEDGTNFQIGNEIKKNSNGQWAMNEYTPRLDDNNASSTAVLIDIKLTFSNEDDFKLTAKATHGNEPYKNEWTYNDYISKNYLSNVIFMQKIDSVSGNTFSVSNTATHYNFITDFDEEIGYFNNYFDGDNDSAKKNAFIDLLTFNVSDIEKEYDFYYLIDYIPQQVSSMYAIMLQRYDDATLTTQIEFLQDIFFEIGKSNK